MNPATIPFTPLIRCALTSTITDIGQLSDAEKRELKRAVKAGFLDKGRGGPYPAIKTVYACKGFDFAADRQCTIDMVLEIDRIESARNSGVK